MNPVLIDISVWILVFQKDPPAAVADKVRKLIIDGKAATCGMIMLELLGGAKTSREYRELLEELQTLHYLGDSDQTWLSACRLSFTLRRKGLTIPSADIHIASLAIHYNFSLIHSDHHFDHIAKHSTLNSHRIK